MRDPADKRDLTQSRDVVARDEAVITPSMKYRLYPFVVAKSEGVRMWDKDGNEVDPLLWTLYDLGIVPGEECSENAEDESAVPGGVPSGDDPPGQGGSYVLVS